MVELSASFWTGLWVALGIAAVISAMLCSYLADVKGHSAAGWFVAGLATGIMGVIAAAGLPHHRGGVLTKKCPSCAEQIRIEALHCPHCAASFDKEEILKKLDAITKSQEGTANAQKAWELRNEMRARPPSQSG